MQSHENLFSHYGNKADVYRKLQDDYRRDQKQVKWCTRACILFLIAAGYVDDSGWRLGLLIGAGLTLVQYLILFIDLSNRNFLMHAIDWFEAKGSDL